MCLDMESSILFQLLYPHIQEVNQYSRFLFFIHINTNLKVHDIYNKVSLNLILNNLLLYSLVPMSEIEVIFTSYCFTYVYHE